MRAPSLVTPRLGRSWLASARLSTRAPPPRRRLQRQALLQTRSLIRQPSQRLLSLPARALRRRQMGQRRRRPGPAMAWRLTSLPSQRCRQRRQSQRQHRRRRQRLLPPRRLQQRLLAATRGNQRPAGLTTKAQTLQRHLLRLHLQGTRVAKAPQLLPRRPTLTAAQPLPHHLLMCLRQQLPRCLPQQHQRRPQQQRGRRQHRPPRSLP